MLCIVTFLGENTIKAFRGDRQAMFVKRTVEGAKLPERTGVVLRMTRMSSSVNQIDGVLNTPVSIRWRRVECAKNYFIFLEEDLFSWATYVEK